MTAQEYRVLRQPIRELYVKIKSLNATLIPVGEFSGSVTGGNYTIDAESTARNACSLDMKLHTFFSIKDVQDMLAANKRFQLYVGIKDLITGHIFWWNKGIYCNTEPCISVNTTERTVSIPGIDLTALLDGTLGGSLGINIKINPTTPLHQAIRSTMIDFGSEKKLNIMSSDKTVPYAIEKSSTDNVWDVIEELTKLYMRYQSFYDENGYFVFSDTRVLANDPVMWDFDTNRWSFISGKRTIRHSNIKNKIIVWGRLLKDGSQPKTVIEVRDATYPSCPFTIEKMGEAAPRMLAIQDDSYFNQSQTDQRAAHEVFLHTNCAETVTIECVPIYSLSVNQLIRLNDSESGIFGKWAVKSINCGLSHDSTMTIEAYKVYDAL